MRPLPALKQAPVVAVLVLAGCGSGASPPKVVRPHLPRALAHDWARQADAVAAALAANDGCLARQRAADLRDSVIAAEQRVGARFQEPLTSAVNDLVERITCVPPPPQPEPQPEPQPPGHGKDHGEGHGKGHGKHKGHGK